MLDERFWEKVEKRADGCWIWTSWINNKGYGQFWLDGRPQYAHRLAYEDALGPIPNGMELDHVRDRGCTSTACVNPDHLEAVTHAVNCQRTMQDECAHGHEFTPENTYHRPDTGTRQCRRCTNDRAAARRRRLAHA